MNNEIDLAYHEIDLAYHEVDFVIPIHKFKINFSYSKEKGMRSFIREFTLRLINISPMKPADVATFLGLSAIELNEAISDLINKGDLEFSNDDELKLTSVSKGYFSGLEDSPLLPTITDDQILLWYELSGFNCIKKTYDEAGWGSCIQLNVENKIVSYSPKYIKTTFQKNFYKYFEEGRILNRESDRKGKQPNIYSVGEVSRLGRAPLRLTTQFHIGQDGRSIERKDFDLFSDSSKIHELITESIYKAQKPNNFEDIVCNAITPLNDELTFGLVASDSIDIEGYMLSIPLLLSNKELTIPLLGPIYSGNNWARVMAAIGKLESNREPIELTWVSPSDSFWGKSHRLNSCLNELIRSEQSTGKKSQRVYSSNIYIQLEKHFSRQLINDQQHEFKNFKSSIFGLNEGLLNGNVEVLLIPNKFVAVVYHFSMPELLPVSFPSGFTSTDKSKIKIIESILEGYIDESNSLGLLSEIRIR